MNKYQNYIIRLAKLEMQIENISFYKAKKKAIKERKGIRDMIVKRYGFNRS